MDDELAALIGRATVRALDTSPRDLGAALSAVGWMESQHAAETLSFTVLFEDHGYLGARTNAVDVVTAAVMGLDRQLPVIWPLYPDATAAEIGGSGVVVIEGAVQRDGLRARNVLCPLNDRLVSLTVSSVDEQISGETVSGSPWVRAQVWGCPSADLGPWPEFRRRAGLAFASELVGVARRLIDGAASGLAQASEGIADVRALIAAGWADGSAQAAEGAVMAAAAAHDAIAQHAALISGEINLAQLHPMRLLVEQGSGRTHRLPVTPTAVRPVSR